MRKRTEVLAVAQALHLSLSLVVKRMHRTRDERLSLPEVSALKLLDDENGTTLTTLAKMEGISAQSLGATIAGLEARKLVVRSADPRDGRQTLLAITPAGRALLHDRKSARLRQIADALASEFTSRELDQLHTAAPLLERLARKI